MSRLAVVLLLFMAPTLWAQCKPLNTDKLDCTVIGPLVSGGVADNMGFQGKKDAWGTITSEAVPAGYALLTVYFSLEGPHPCTGTMWFNPWKGQPKPPGDNWLGLEIVNLPHANIGKGSWATCQLDTKTDTAVTWKY